MRFTFLPRGVNFGLIDQRNSSSSCTSPRFRHRNNAERINSSATPSAFAKDPAVAGPLVCSRSNIRSCKSVGSLAFISASLGQSHSYEIVWRRLRNRGCVGDSWISVSGQFRESIACSRFGPDCRLNAEVKTESYFRKKKLNTTWHFNLVNCRDNSDSSESVLGPQG